MSAPRDPIDLRRAGEDVVLDALRAGHPLALAEAYHRSVPAGHAVARRLMSSAEDVEDLLLAVYTRLWTDAPATGPLEGWVRRMTWTIGVERLRATGTAPASPSAAGLVPDLPAPDVRFLDAAERAIAELPDEQRRALLLAHDKGVPSIGQEEGAAQSLTLALLALAGPEASGADRDAMQADSCEDLTALGDWCLGVAGTREHNGIEQAIAERPGCAATSRAVRRGRRRVEGLPATPDMGQRILVTVLTTSGGLAAPSASGGDVIRTDGTAAGGDVAVGGVAVGAGALGGASDDPLADDLTAGDLTAGDPPSDDLASNDLSSDDLASNDLSSDDLASDDLVLDPTGPLSAADDPHGGPVDVAGPEADVADGAADPFAPPRDPFDEGRDELADTAAFDPVAADDGTADGDLLGDEADEGWDDDPFADEPGEGGDRVEEETVVVIGDAVGDTADLPQAEDRADAETSGADAAARAGYAHGREQDWRPDPGSTAELRLSDILAEGGDDDPFAGLDDEDDPFEEPAPARPGGDPYAALRGLDGDEQQSAEQPARPADGGGRLAPIAEDAHLVGGYEEGQEGHDDVAAAGSGSSGRMAAVLAWILPIIGGSALGVLIAILVFGAPS